MTHSPVSAKQIAGNWHAYDGWSPHQFWYELGDDWGKVSLFSEQSGLLTKSNGRAIVRALQPYADAEPSDVISTFSDNTFGGGDVEEIAIRVYREKDGEGWAAGLVEMGRPYERETTEAFQTFEDLCAQMDKYPVLDEEDWSREQEAAADEYIECEYRKFVSDEAPEYWPSEVMSWLNNSREFSGESEDRDGTGATPQAAAVLRALHSINETWLDDDYKSNSVTVELQNRFGKQAVYVIPAGVTGALSWIARFFVDNDKVATAGAEAVTFAAKFGFKVIDVKY